jgi:hypothetical protein
MLVGDASEQQRIGREEAVLGDCTRSLVEELDLPAAAVELVGVARRLHHAVQR